MSGQHLSMWWSTLNWVLTTCRDMKRKIIYEKEINKKAPPNKSHHPSSLQTLNTNLNTWIHSIRKRETCKGYSNSKLHVYNRDDEEKEGRVTQMTSLAIGDITRFLVVHELLLGCSNIWKAGIIYNLASSRTDPKCRLLVSMLALKQCLART